MPTITRSAAAAGLILLAAVACSGSSHPSSSPGSPSPGDTPSGQELSFSQCMRSHGVADFPDPGSSGAPKESAQQLGVSDSQFEAADSSCRHLLPDGGAGPDQVQLQQVATLGLEFARCMRAHGVALADPGSNGRIPDPATLGIDQGSPHFEAANQACGTDRPPYFPSNSAYNTYARSQGA